jgi:hypothetical protein
MEPHEKMIEEEKANIHNVDPRELIQRVREYCIDGCTVRLAQRMACMIEYLLDKEKDTHPVEFRMRVEKTFEEFDKQLKETTKIANEIKEQLRIE